ncbi:MAG: ABC transporter permease [Proteobacteria bacterium]|nr:ABC transporter permease [Pseudomonadota bacterium]
MTIFQIALRSLAHRKFVTIMTTVSIALSVTLLLGVERVRESGKEAFGGAISKTDLIVGSRSGSLALLLSSVFHIGSPNQNILRSTVDLYSKHQAVDWVVPFSLGDGYRGFPVIGTSKEFFSRYHYGSGESLAFSAGDAGGTADAVVLGASVASELGQHVGAKIIVSHGHSEDGDGFEKHEDHPLVVSGILSPTGTPVDRGVWISLESMDAMHHGVEGAAREAATTPGHQDILSSTGQAGARKLADDGVDEGDDDDEEDAVVEVIDDHVHEGLEGTTEDVEQQPRVSGFFLATKNRSAALTLMREINESSVEPLTAVMPAVVLNDLWRALAVGESALSLISGLVMAVGISGMWVALHILASTRRREMAVFRAMGASPVHILGLMTGEAVLLCVGGIIVGFVFLYCGVSLLSPLIIQKYGVSLKLLYPSSREWIYLLSVVFASGLAGFLPALKAYRSALHDGLSVRF